MQGKQATISIEQYLSLKQFEENYSDEASEAIADLFQECRVIDFSQYQRKAKEKRAHQARARERSFVVLNVVKGLVLDYELKMIKSAQEIDLEAYRAQYQQDPLEQIQNDMRRLGDFAQALEWALTEKGASTVIEATGVLRQHATEELVDTLNYILMSDYFGFKAIKDVMECAVLFDGVYSEDTATCCRLWNELSEAGYEYSLNSIASLCLPEAMAM